MAKITSGEHIDYRHLRKMLHLELAGMTTIWRVRQFHALKTLLLMIKLPCRDSSAFFPARFCWLRDTLPFARVVSCQNIPDLGSAGAWAADIQRNWMGTTPMLPATMTYAYHRQGKWAGARKRAKREEYQTVRKTLTLKGNMTYMTWNQSFDICWKLSSINLRRKRNWIDSFIPCFHLRAVKPSTLTDLLSGEMPNHERVLSRNEPPMERQGVHLRLLWSRPRSGPLQGHLRHCRILRMLRNWPMEDTLVWSGACVCQGR